MSVRILKFPLRILDSQPVELPDSARILSAGMDPTGNFCLWAEVPVPLEDPSMSARTICIFGTGAVINPQRLNFIDTVRGGIYMWHVYEQIDE